MKVTRRKCFFYLIVGIFIMVNLVNTTAPPIPPIPTTFERCDHGTPDALDDCTTYQTEEASCCYFKYGSVKGCILLNFRYLGNTIYGGMEVNCHSSWIQHNILRILLLVLYILL